MRRFAAFAMGGWLAMAAFGCASPDVEGADETATEQSTAPLFGIPQVPGDLPRRVVTCEQLVRLRCAAQARDGLQRCADLHPLLPSDGANGLYDQAAQRRRAAERAWCDAEVLSVERQCVVDGFRQCLPPAKPGDLSP